MQIRKVLPLLGLLLLGCSDSTDPLADKCEQTCNIDDTHPCYANGLGVDECVKQCRALAGSVDRNPAYLKGCAECVAGQFVYAIKPAPCTATSADPSCCYPGYVIRPKVEDPACAATCIEPDGGM